MGRSGPFEADPVSRPDSAASAFTDDFGSNPSGKWHFSHRHVNALCLRESRYST